MPLIRIDSRRIHDWESFHDVFTNAFGFPGFYGRNMNAWIDCMTCLDEVEAGMTTIHGTSSDPVVLQLDEVDHLPYEIYEVLVDCAAFVNWRRIELGEPAILMLSYDRSP